MIISVSGITNSATAIHSFPSFEHSTTTLLNGFHLSPDAGLRREPREDGPEPAAGDRHSTRAGSLTHKSSPRRTPKPKPAPLGGLPFNGFYLLPSSKQQSVEPVAQVRPEPLSFSSVAFWADHLAEAETAVGIPRLSTSDAHELSFQPSLKFLKHYFSTLRIILPLCAQP